ncbi:MAG: leucine-rich repeat domain-containing protein [Erysipelotrichaceae bacterium]|jgi:hypothetical protein|nr:leucine-rich repeat domain-containing protein [Erysipelotrichaceae bacterium]
MAIIQNLTEREFKQEPDRRTWMQKNKKSLIAHLIVIPTFIAVIITTYALAINYRLKQIANIPFLSYEYVTVNGVHEVHIVKGVGDYPAVFEIPAYIEGMKVTKINSSAFIASERLTEVIIPDTVTTIGSYAFQDCSNLRTVTNHGDSITEIGTSAFLNTPFLDDNHEEWVTLGRVIIAHRGTLPANTVIAFSEGFSHPEIPNPNIITLDESYAHFGDSLFKNQTGLVFVEIPAYLSVISDSLFENCTSLIGVDFITSDAQQAISIGNRSFANCTALTDINLPSNVTSIGNEAFMGSSLQGEINFLETLTRIGVGAFKDCAFITKITALGLKELPDQAFLNATALTEVEFSNEITQIGIATFQNVGLTQFTIPSKVATLRTDVFSNCQHLTTIYAAARGITVIQERAFYNTPLNSFILLNEDGSIYPTSATGKVTLPLTLGVFGASVGEVFGLDDGNNPPTFTTIDIPWNVLAISGNSFMNNVHLEQVNIESGSRLTSIGHEAFNGARSLKEFVFETTTSARFIPEYRAFQNCSSLTKVRFPKQTPSLEPGLFDGATSLNDFVIPIGVTAIKSRAFADINGTLTLDIAIDDIIDDNGQLRYPRINEIQENAFVNCSKITINIYSSQPWPAIPETAYPNLWKKQSNGTPAWHDGSITINHR